SQQRQPGKGIPADSGAAGETLRPGSRKKPSLLPQKLKFTYKEQQEFDTIDDEITALEEKIAALDQQMEANATNSVKLRELMEEQEQAQQQLEEKMDRWVYLNDLAEQIESQNRNR
ncbi:MAG: ABC transporter ATP-binding protein, partial [Lachnospiraceae bacterium]|nr:ABC transporter ATP-binding protein [Lachnospiraceae bacterium]